ncbi:MAG: glycoside hydrolase family 2 protein [Candidatus Nanopelagicales bacterium]
MPNDTATAASPPTVTGEQLDWLCIQTSPDEVIEPADLNLEARAARPAAVPGTAAAAVRGADGIDAALQVDYDAFDWWFVADLQVTTTGGYRFDFGGLATVADVWIDDQLLLHSDSMFEEANATAVVSAGGHRLSIRFHALRPLLRQKRPRPRWRSSLVPERGLRWWRTTALGRMPGWAGFAAPVGPWRPITIRALAKPIVEQHSLRSVVVDGRAQIHTDITFSGPVAATRATLHVGKSSCELAITSSQMAAHARGTLTIDAVDLWWPHTHGSQPLYDARLEVDGDVTELGRVGFRTIEADTADDGFTLVINGVPMFARGACWVPPDVVSLNAGPHAIRAALNQVKAAGMNMVRVPGTMVYESSDFWDRCDELGILVWQDAMITTYDPPSDDDWLDSLRREMTGVLTPLSSRPSIAVVSGGSETEQQPAMLGLERADYDMPSIHQVIPEVVSQVLPGVPYVTSSPSGPGLPTHSSAGVANYFGVGAYLRPLHDARLANVRFATECLAFSNPPENETVDEFFGGPLAAGQRPDWKAAVPRDAGASWDFEDVRDFYTHLIFGIEPMLVRYSDPARALDLGRAAVAQVIATTFTEWRRGESTCAGGLVLSLRDLIPGAGWGLVDSLGRPKSVMYALSDVLAPVSIGVTDEGLDGLAIHVFNDPANSVAGKLTATVIDRNGRALIEAATQVEVDGHGSMTLDLDSMIGSFRDINYAYRFGPQVYDAVLVTLTTEAGQVSSTCLLASPWRGQQRDVTLSATAQRVSEGQWSVQVSADQLAEWVAIDVPGMTASDSWFHLFPGETRIIQVSSRVTNRRLAGTVRALNAFADAPIVVEQA